MRFELYSLGAALVCIGCGGRCPEPSRIVLTDTAQTETGPEVPAASEFSAPESAPAAADSGPTCGVEIGASQTEIEQRFGLPDATSEPQEVATEYHYYGKLLIIYRQHRVEDVILQEGGQCPSP